jgi:hypothetical protein
MCGQSRGAPLQWRYLRRSIDYQECYVPSTGAIIATVTVNLHNLAPTKGQPPYVIGLGGRRHQETGRER